MSYVVTPFEVASQALAEPVKTRFVHLLSGIATRHSDTIDCYFLVNGRQVMVTISCAALTELREHEGKYFTDQQLAEIASRFLHQTLDAGYDPAEVELFINGSDLRTLAQELGYL